MELADVMALVHPAIAVAVVFPIIGTVVNAAWQTRQRRLQVADGGIAVDSGQLTVDSCITGIKSLMQYGYRLYSFRLFMSSPI